MKEEPSSDLLPNVAGVAEWFQRSGLAGRAVLTVDETAPCVVPTTVGLREQRQFEAWLAENPTLAALVQRAIELAEAETEE